MISRSSWQFQSRVANFGEHVPVKLLLLGKTNFDWVFRWEWRSSTFHPFTWKRFVRSITFIHFQHLAWIMATLWKMRRPHFRLLSINQPPRFSNERVSVCFFFLFARQRKIAYKSLLCDHDRITLRLLQLGNPATFGSFLGIFVPNASKKNKKKIPFINTLRLIAC